MTNDEKKEMRDAAEGHRAQAARYRADAEFAPYKAPTLFEQADEHDRQARELERIADPVRADAEWLKRLRKCDNITASERRLIGMLDRAAPVNTAARAYVAARAASLASPDADTLAALIAATDALVAAVGAS